MIRYMDLWSAVLKKNQGTGQRTYPEPAVLCLFYDENCWFFHLNRKPGTRGEVWKLYGHHPWSWVCARSNNKSQSPGQATLKRHWLIKREYYAYSWHNRQHTFECQLDFILASPPKSKQLSWRYGEAYIPGSGWSLPHPNYILKSSLLVTRYLDVWSHWNKSRKLKRNLHRNDI